MLKRDEHKKPYVIAVANEKGGVGKTTTTLAIGTILAQRGFKVLFIDLDPQGNLTLSLGYKPQDMPASSVPYQVETENGLENADLIFARPLVVDNSYRLRVNSRDHVLQLSQDLHDMVSLPYDYVLIDCPPSLEKLAIDALLVSNFLIVPTLADFYSAYALKNVLEMIGIVRQRGNPKLMYRILITLFDRRNSIHHSILNQLTQIFSGGMFNTMIEVDAQLRRAAILGFPTTKCRGAMQYHQLVEEMLKYIREVESA